MRTLISCGGTADPIDDVRHVTNFATGRFGLALARHAPGPTTAACSALAAAHAAGDTPAHVTVERFASTDDLADVYARHAGDVDVVIAAAAVADYRPVKVPGKIRSDADTLHLTLERTPKLVDQLRAQHPRPAYLVGFKLLVDVDPCELWDAVRDLLHRARLDLVVANDLSECHGGQHPVWLVTAEGGAIRVVGDRDHVARRIWEFIELRRNITMSRTTLHPHVPPDAQLAGTWRDAHMLAADAQLLFDPSGNIAAVDRARGGDEDVRLLISPRGVDKSLIDVGSALVVDVDTAARHNRCHGPVKCSIDTAPTAQLAAATDVDAFIHFHQLWGVADQATLVPLPCGAAEEADLVVDALHAANVRHAPVWLVELTHHGALLGAQRAQLAHVQDAWRRVLAGWAAHLADVGQPDVSRLTRPIWHGARPVGVVSTRTRPDGRDGHAVWLDEQARGHGVGRAVVGQLTARQQRVVTADECDVVDFWRSVGFVCERASDGMWDCRPPTVEVTDPVVEGLARRGSVR